MARPPVLIDAHVHIWAPEEESDKYPYAGQLLGAAASNKPPMPGHVDLLVEAMQAAGVSGALVVQPGNHLYDHSYLTAALARHPGRLLGCLLADPSPGGGGVLALQQLATEHGYRAVRFNPYLWPDGEKMTNEVGRAMYARAGELGLPVGHMPFKGFMRHADEIEELLRSCPGTVCILDHLGFCRADDLDSPEWMRLRGLARYPQVYVKASAFFRVSAAAGFPYADAVAALRRLVDVFGAQRVMWGSDWPWVTNECGYARAWQLLDAVDAAAPGGEPVLTEDERHWVLGGTAQSLFPGAWSSSA